MRKKKNRAFVSAVVVAAGNATRMDGIDKQFAELDGVPVVIRSIMVFECSERVDEIVVVTRMESVPELNRQVRDFGCEKVRAIVTGGRTRQESVFCGVACLDERCDYVAVHDGARPLVLTGAVEACLDDAMEYGAAMLGVPVKDTIKVVDQARLIEKTIDRSNLFLAQTPQIFRLDRYRAAMLRARERGLDYSDDCQLMESAGEKVYVSRGHTSNIKITTPDDLSYAQTLLEQRMEEGE